MPETPTWWLNSSEWGDSSLQRFAKLNFAAIEVYKHECKGHVVMEGAQNFSYQREFWFSYCWEEKTRHCCSWNMLQSGFFIQICLLCLYSIQTQIVSCKFTVTETFRCLQVSVQLLCSSGSLHWVWRLAEPEQKAVPHCFSGNYFCFRRQENWCLGVAT